MIRKMIFFVVFVFMFHVANLGLAFAESSEVVLDENIVQQLKSVFVGADSFELIPDIEPESEGETVIQETYRAFIQGEENGFVFKISSPGYRGNIVTLIAISSIKQKLIGIQILEQNETPSLGDEITKPNFLVQFLNKSITDRFEIGEDIDAISGATVSSAAVAKAGQKATELMKIFQMENEKN